jgi:hypothetical protein
VTALRRRKRLNGGCLSAHNTELAQRYALRSYFSLKCRRSVISPRTLDRQWVRARETIGRADLRFHDLRHTGLTMVAMTGATIAEIMAAGGHASHVAALRYQHASQDRMTAITDALAAMAEGRMEPLSSTKGHARGTTAAEAESNADSSEPSVASTEHANPKRHARRHRHNRRKSAGQQPDSEQQPPPRTTGDTELEGASQTTCDEQPQRDSNPCLHLERGPEDKSPTSDDP